MTRVGLARPVLNGALAAMTGLAIAGGLGLTILEGFVHEWPRQFHGDFSAAMYSPQWWDGTGIMYGPVFVMERWLVNAWPQVFTTYFFALADVPFVVVACALTLDAARCSRVAAFVAVAAWLCFRFLYYSFSVAANPEIIELFFLCLAWFGASRAMPTLSWSATAVATLTKVVPVTFAPLMLLRGSRKAFFVACATALVIAGVVGYGQHLAPLELIHALVVPTDPLGDLTVTQAERILPRSSYQWVGLSDAIMRGIGLSDGDPALHLVQNVTNVVTFMIYGLVAGLAVWLLAGRNGVPETTKLSLSYGMFFAMMPLTTLITHPHTYLFLLPTWTAVAALVMGDHLKRRRLAFGVLFALCYVLMGVASVGALMRTDLLDMTVFAEPIWSDLAVIALLAAYSLLLMRESGAGALRPARERGLPHSDPEVAIGPPE